jgi:hypothetical protein
MSYWNNKGKYQKAYNFLYEKLIPPSGTAKNALGEALRIVSKAAYRYNNDGDTYEDCIDNGIIQDLSKKSFPFDGEYYSLGIELDSLLYNRAYDDAINLVLINIMLSLSSTTHIYNPSSNRLVIIDSEAGRKALKELDIDQVIINYCGKNEPWIPESLMKDGVKISKPLTEETKKELKCDTVSEFYQESRARYGSGKKTRKLKLSHDNTILSTKFKQIDRQHKKSVKEHQKNKKERDNRYKTVKKREMKHKIKILADHKQYYEMLKNMTINTRVATIKKMTTPKFWIDSLVKMTLLTLAEYKEKNPTTADQKKHRAEVITKLVAQLNIVGKEILQTLSNYTPGETINRSTIRLDQGRDDKLDELLVEILGSNEAVDELWHKCCK